MKTMDDMIQDLEERKQTLRQGGGPKRIERQHAKGRLTARERIDRFYDPGTFVEIDLFARHRCTYFGMENREIPADAVVTGHGKVDGRLIFVYSEDFTSMGGTFGEYHGAKCCKIIEMAMKMGAPVVGLNDSGGARIQEGIDSLSAYGKIFYRHTMASGVVPQIQMIMGPVAGGQSYSPALCDFIFMVDGSYMFIAGPNFVKAITGEDIDTESLGGPAVHTQISGVADDVFANDEECIDRTRELISFLPNSNKEQPPIIDTDDDPYRLVTEVEDIVPADGRKIYNMFDVIYSLVDNGYFFELKPDWAKNIIIGFARFGGRPVGSVENQTMILAGGLDVHAADKAARFVRFCDAFNIPLIQLEDAPAYIIGSRQEYLGIIRHGAKMLHAYSEATVPKITVILRKAFAGAYLAMCSKDLGADQVFAWPTAEITLVGPQAAASIIFRRDVAAGETPEEKQKILEEKTQFYSDQYMNPYLAASRMYVDDIIRPRETRKAIFQALEMLADKEEDRPYKKHSNIPL